MKEIWHTSQIKIDKQSHAHYKELMTQTVSALSALSYSTRTASSITECMAGMGWPMTHWNVVLWFILLFLAFEEMFWPQELILFQFLSKLIFTILSKNIKHIDIHAVLFNTKEKTIFYHIQNRNWTAQRHSNVSSCQRNTLLWNVILSFL